jgi:DNA-binding NarL/FixJ family response regulator/tetratricopeptide (TPR) repeat protein
MKGESRVAERLIGRGEELASLQRALAEVETGHPCAIALLGEPGIGKSRLLAELARLAEARGYLVLSGRASELERDLPYWLFVDALDGHLRSFAHDRLQPLQGRMGAELAWIFPGLAGLGGDSAAVLDERYRAHWAVRELLEWQAAAQPLLLVLDDLHWADPAAIELLGGLLRRPPQARVLVALSLRLGQAPARLSTALEQATRTGALQRLELGPLSRSEAEGLLGGTVQPEVTRALYEQSGGNPFYLEQLARALHPAAPSGVGLDAGKLEVPPAVAAALTEELDRLSAGARSLLQGAAVVGDPFEPELAAAAAGHPNAETPGTLDRLLAVDLVRATDDPRRFRFRHPLVRHAVYAATPAGWRLAAHARAARALADRGDPPAAQAHHLAQSARRGDRGAVALLRQAADAAAQRAPESAARWYQAALELLPGDAAPEDRIRLLEPLARILAGTGQFTRSHAALLELLELVPAQAAGERVRLIGACAGVEHLMGQHHAAHARLVPALDQLPDQRSADAAALMLELAADAFFAGDHRQVLDWGLRARATAGPLGQAALTAAAEATISLAHAHAGRTADAHAACSATAALLDQLSNDELAQRLDAVNNLAVSEVVTDRYRDAVAHADRGLRVGRATGQGQLFPNLTQSLGLGLAMLGRLEESAEVLEGAIAAARLAANPQILAWALLGRAWTALMAGDLEVALRTGEEAAELTGGLDASMLSPFATGMLAVALVEVREPARGLDLLLAAAGGPELPGLPPQWAAVFHEVAVRAWLAQRRQSEAELAVRRCEATAAAVGLPYATAIASRARAAITLAAGDHVAAAEAALASAAGADAIEVPVEAARARILAGRALAAAGDRARAAAELQRAATALEACGAVGHLDQAERALQRLGRRYQRRHPTTDINGQGLASLTPREREIAQLLGEARTNREIAAELFVSEKTVETHLRHIFGKLGVSSRASVARALKR